MANAWHGGNRSLLGDVGKCAIHSGPAYPECCGDSARRLTTSVHALSQSHLRLVKSRRATDGLPTCPTSVTRCCAAWQRTP